MSSRRSEKHNTGESTLNMNVSVNMGACMATIYTMDRCLGQKKERCSSEYGSINKTKTYTISSFS